MNKVSIVIPFYNTEKYLAEAVSGVLSQTFTDFELILIDDGSRDGSADIARSFAAKDSRVKLYQKSNGGASSARNAGMEKAEGEYLYFLDSDDRIAPDTIEKLVNHADKTQSDIVFFDAYTVYDGSDKISTENYSHKGKYEDADGYTVMCQLLKNREFHVGVWSFFYRRDYLERDNIRFAEGIMYEDMLFAFEVFARAKKASYLPEYLYYRKYREGSVMTSKISDKNFISAEKVYYEIIKLCERLSLSEDETAKAYTARCAYNALNVYLKLENKDKFKQNYEALKKDIISHGAFSDKALAARCKSYAAWAAYKIIKKVTG